MKTLLQVIILSFLFFVSCKKEQKLTKDISSEKTNITYNLNLSVFLDLSDRINPNKYSNASMEYYQRDLGYIQTISKAFETHLKQKPIRQVNDKIQVFFEPEPSNTKINDLAKSLKFHFTKNNTTKESISKVSTTYNSISSEIYNLAINEKKYEGSDIWRFFKDKVKDYCIEKGSRNILVIITDGYMYHQNTKIEEGGKTSFLTPEYIRSFNLNQSNYLEKIKEKNLGFIPTTDNLENLEIMVIGINPNKGNPYEKEVINAYWENWFKEMGVKKYVIKSSDLPTNLDALITQCLLKKE